MIADAPVVYLDERGGLVGKETLLFEHGLKYHAVVLGQKGENHVEMDKRVGVHGQFLHQYAEMLALAGKGLRQIVDALGIGADALADAQKVARADVHIAALGAGQGIPGGGIEHLHLEKVAEDGVVEQRLAFAHLKTHGVDEHTVVDGRRGVAREKQVVQGLQQVAVVGKTVPLVLLIAFYEHFGQPGTVERHEVFVKTVAHLTLLRGAPVMTQTAGHQPLADVVVVE